MAWSRRAELRPQARKQGYCKRLDPRVKLAAAFALICGVLASHRVIATFALLTSLIVLALGCGLYAAMRPIWLSTLGFSAYLALPTMWLTPGEALAHMPWLHWAVTGRGPSDRCIPANALCDRGHRVSAHRPYDALATYPAVPSMLQAAHRRDHADRYDLPLCCFACGSYTRHVPVQEKPHCRRPQSHGAEAGERRYRGRSPSGKEYEASLHVHRAMQSRGYRGKSPSLERLQMRWPDWAALLVAVTIAGVMGGGHGDHLPQGP